MAIINGTKRGDSLNGTRYDDQIDGKGGNDSIRGLQGNDDLTGGPGNDRFIFEKTLTSNGFDTIRDYSYSGTNGADWLDLSNAISRISSKQTINDYVKLYASEGGGALLYIDRDGPGSAPLEGPWALLENLNPGDPVKVRVGADSSSSDDGQDYTVLVAANPLVESEDDDPLSCNPINGGSRNDKLNGTEGADCIDGKEGNDVLRGKGGDDILTGGLGRDTFVFESTRAANGFDTITDYGAPGSNSDPSDTLDLSAIFPKGVKCQKLDKFVWLNAGEGGATLWIDRDGTRGPDEAQSWALLQELDVGDMVRVRTGGVGYSSMSTKDSSSSRSGGSSSDSMSDGDVSFCSIQVQGGEPEQTKIFVIGEGGARAKAWFDSNDNGVLDFSEVNKDNRAFFNGVNQNVPLDEGSYLVEILGVSATRCDSTLPIDLTGFGADDAIRVNFKANEAFGSGNDSDRVLEPAYTAFDEVEDNVMPIRWSEFKALAPLGVKGLTEGFQGYTFANYTYRETVPLTEGVGSIRVQGFKGDVGAVTNVLIEVGMIRSDPTDATGLLYMGYRNNYLDGPQDEGTQQAACGNVAFWDATTNISAEQITVIWPDVYEAPPVP